MHNEISEFLNDTKLFRRSEADFSVQVACDCPKMATWPVVISWRGGLYIQKPCTHPKLTALSCVIVGLTSWDQDSSSTGSLSSGATTDWCCWWDPIPPRGVWECPCAPALSPFHQQHGMDTCSLHFMKLFWSSFQYEQPLNTKMYHLQTWKFHCALPFPSQWWRCGINLGLVVIPGMPLLILLYPGKWPSILLFLSCSLNKLSNHKRIFPPNL